MGKRSKVKIYLEKNRDGDFDRIDVYKDKDKEDTTLGFWVKLPDKSMVKVGEFIFTEDMELPDEPTEPPKEEKPPVIDLDENQNIAGNVNEDVTMQCKVTDANGNETITDIVWLQTAGPTTVNLQIEGDNIQTATFNTAVEGDYLFTITATDKTGLSATAGVNVKIRTLEPEPEPGEFKPVLTAFGDSNSTTRSQTVFDKIDALNVPVIPLGDYEYDADFDDFKSKFAKLKPKATVADKGNHDDTESESQAIEDANKAYWGWSSPAVGKSTVGNIGIISMDTQDGDITDKNGSQYQFIENSLKEFQALDWRIVTVHKPFRSPKSKHSEETDVRDVYEPLFEKYKVSLVGQGHNHNQWVSKLIKGTRYFGNGNSGNDLYQIDSNRDYIEWSDDNNFGYAIIDQKTDKTQLRLRFMNTSNQVLKTVIIDKFATTPEPEPEPTPIPTGLIWSSNIHGKWNDGNKRTITKKQGGQVADDKSIFVAASGSPKLEIDGDGVAHLVSGSGGVDNLSLKGLCSHQGNITPLKENADGLDGPQRGGGEGFSIDHSGFDCKREMFHNEHDSLGGGSLPKKVEDNKWHAARFIWKHESSGIRLQGFINYNDGQGFRKVMDKVDTNADEWFMNKSKIKNTYIWIRLNNSDHGRIYIMAMNWDAQLTVPFMFEPSENSIALKDVELVSI